MLTAAAYPTASDRDSERTLMVAPRAQDLEGLRSRDDEPTSVERNPVTQPSRTRRAAPRVRRIRRLESAPKMVLEVEDDSSSVVDLPVPDLAAIEVYRASHLWTATAPVATRADVTADRFEATVISKRTKRPVRPVILAATAGILVGLSLVCGALSAAHQARSHVSPTSPHVRSACPGPASCLAQSTEEDTVPIRRVPQVR